ncbi:hypothetical protein D3C87_1534210 [compost metagenome]
MAAEAIVGLEHEPVVDEDRSDRVDAVEVEIPVAVEIAGVDRNRALDHPVLVRHPLHVVLVAADIGIADGAGLLQRRVHVTRQRHGNRVASIAGGKLPFAREVDMHSGSVEGVREHFHIPLIAGESAGMPVCLNALDDGIRRVSSLLTDGFRLLRRRSMRPPCRRKA